MQPVPSSLSPLPSPVVPTVNSVGTTANPEITANSKVATTIDSDSDPDRLLSSYDYFLPESQIAQAPAVPRDCSRLLVVGAQDHQHRLFYQLSTCLQPGDLLVMNDTRVIPARLLGHKLAQARPTNLRPSYGQEQGKAEPKPLEIEALLLEELSQRCWLALVRPGRRLKPGSQVIFGDLTATILETDLATRGRILEFDLAQGEGLLERLEKLGQVPLPPYIHNSTAQPEQYQTVYAHNPGAVAAPTAGLHFTPEVLENLQQNEIDHCFLTLHVGVGTFRPVESANITDHQMHQEWVNLPTQTVEKIQQTQARGGRVIAVGTTVVRALEGAVQQGGLQPWQGKTNLFIYPGYRWQVVQGMITNFHLPRSSLLMLVSALIGRERLLQVYQAAIDAQYRFYSFGDAMLILPEAVLPEVRVGCDVGSDSGTH